MARLSTTLPALLFLCSMIAGFASPAPAQESEPAVTDAANSNELALETTKLLQAVKQNLAEIEKLRANRDTAEGEERQLADRRLLRKGLEALSKVDAVVDNVLEQEGQGLDATEFRASAEDLVNMIAPVARHRIEGLKGELALLRSQRASTTGEALVQLESQISQRNAKMTTILNAALDNQQNMAALGLPTEIEEAFLTEELLERAEDSAERIRLAMEQSAMLQDRLGEKAGDAELQVRLSAIETRRDSNRSELEQTVAMMELLELDSAEYQRLLIESSGQLSADILDKDVALSLFGRWVDRLKTWMIESGPQIFFKTLVFLLILFVFRLLSRLTRKVVAKAVSSSKLNFSQLLRKMFVSVSGNIVLIIGLLVALSQLGFALGPVLAGLGIMGFIVGFALQDVLGNFAAGMMILIYRPFDVGDMVEAAGVFGKVSAMSMVSTTVLTIDNQTLVIPNGKIWGDVIKNVTAQKFRRVDLVFGISYSDDIPRTEKVLTEILAEHPKVLEEPESVVKLHNLGDSSVDFVVRPWVDTDDYWDVYWDVTREVKMRFDREGISIPFPQRDMHLYQENPTVSGVGREEPGATAAP